MKRYYKSTDGEITVFRATERTYASAWWTILNGHMHALGFSSRPQSIYRGDNGNRCFPAIEITKAEYDALVARKNARMGGSFDAAARDSWVRE